MSRFSYCAACQLSGKCSCSVPASKEAGKHKNNKKGTAMESENSHQNTALEASETYPAPLEFKLEDFREDIAELDMPEEQAKELLQTLWNMMAMFVDLGWGVENMQAIMPDLYKEIACDSAALLDSKMEEKGEAND